MPNEMIKLRNALDERGISWQDLTDDFGRGFPFIDMHIYRTKFKHKGKSYSVISGFGTYGGQKGLLEMMINGSEPIGSLTAEQILEMMEGNNDIGTNV